MWTLFQVHYPPYLFECFLYAPVHDLESAAEIGNGAAVFKLRKADAGIWPSLQSVGSGKLFIDYSLSGVVSVCLSVCMSVCQTITFESLNVGSSYLHIQYISREYG